ncbi:MAG: glutaredoxin family protein [Burkholderiales bacterium]|nr:glutaredoxin family protein [Burkholderiales bacterium]
MKRSRRLITLTIFSTTLFAVTAHAQLYKWVGPDGKINYSDRPPPATQKVLEKTSLPETAAGTNLPFDLAAAVSKNPVTLYAADSCAPCNDGRNLLKANGIPFSEKSVSTNEDIEKLKQVSGDSQVPFLLVGSGKLFGFNSEEWKTALKNANYPATNRLPASYQYPPVAPAAPVVAKVQAKEKNDVKPPAPPPVKKPTNENGFRF